MSYHIKGSEFCKTVLYYYLYKINSEVGISSSKTFGKYIEHVFHYSNKSSNVQFCNNPHFDIKTLDMSREVYVDVLHRACGITNKKLIDFCKKNLNKWIEPNKGVYYMMAMATSQNVKFSSEVCKYIIENYDYHVFYRSKLMRVLVVFINNPTRNNFFKMVQLKGVSYEDIKAIVVNILNNGLPDYIKEELNSINLLKFSFALVSSSTYIINTLNSFNLI